MKHIIVKISVMALIFYAPIESAKANFIKSCNLPTLRSPAIPTEKVAKEVYISIYQGVVDRYSEKDRFDVKKYLKKNGIHIVVRDLKETWEIFQQSKNTGSGGFSIEIEKCTGKVNLAGFSR